jgi:hypothetical protein
MVQQISDIAASLISSVLNDGKVRILDADNDGKLDTIYVANNTTPGSATRVLRINQNGMALSTNGYNGPFYTGIDWLNAWHINMERMGLQYQGTKYVPTEITYKNASGNNETITVLAEEGLVPDLEL